jgi:hypothetical protein
MDDRQLKIHVARVQLNECRARRHSRVNRHFYWHLFHYAQKCRRDAAAISREPRQGGLF